MRWDLLEACVSGASSKGEKRDQGEEVEKSQLKAESTRPTARNGTVLRNHSIQSFLRNYSTVFFLRHYLIQYLIRLVCGVLWLLSTILATQNSNHWGGGPAKLVVEKTST